MTMATRKPWVGGNWKCNGTIQSVEALCTKLNESTHSDKDCEVVVFPPAIHIPKVMSKFGPKYQVGTQNCSMTANGAFTGELSVEMIEDMKIGWTLIGHSERRQIYRETDDVVAKKVEQAMKTNLKIAICIGETLCEREKQQTAEVCKRQMNAVIPCVTKWENVVIAYEPVWAIGTGKVATPQQAQEAHDVVRKLLSEKVGANVAAAVRIVYGGSVTETNCASLIQQEDIDGFLVGGASLKPAFLDIVACTQK